VQQGLAVAIDIEDAASYCAWSCIRLSKPRLAEVKRHTVLRPNWSRDRVLEVDNATGSIEAEIRAVFSIGWVSMSSATEVPVR
jgi:hypothetical protein